MSLGIIIIRCSIIVIVVIIIIVIIRIMDRSLPTSLFSEVDAKNAEPNMLGA